MSFALVEKKKETITESAGRQQKKKIGKFTVSYVGGENKLLSGKPKS